MNISLVTGVVELSPDRCIIAAARQKDGAPVFGKTLRALDSQTGGALLRAAARRRFEGAAGKTFSFYSEKGRIIIAGLGDDSPTARHAALAAALAAAGLGQKPREKKKNETPPEEIVVAAALDAAGAAHNAMLADIARAAVFAGYRFEKDSETPVAEGAVSIAARGKNAAAQKAVARGAAVGEGANWARHLGELPPNICTPEFLAATARRLAKGGGIGVKILDEKEIRKLKMGGVLAVSAGSARPPRVAIMTYQGGRGAPIALVGKGVTFDTGGISLKPGAAMDEMKFDMCGAASVFGVMRALQILRPKINVTGIVAAVENMPDGNATRPGDIYTAMSGKSVEVLNTDAEGRLILADALTYAARFVKPKQTIDMATLTGACVVALGHEASGLCANHRPLAAALHRAGDAAGDRCWPLPLWREHREMLKSAYADLANIGGGRGAGTLTAAAFLQEFAEGHWAHLDIAGSAWNAKKRATGRPVPLLLKFLLG